MLPLAYFPTSILFVDDEKSYLRSLWSGVSHKGIVPLMSSKPREMLKKINAVKGNYIDSYVKNIPESQYEHRALEVEISNIHKEIYNHQRFEFISTVVVDYHMPSMNGLDFCLAIENPYIQKILLTGVADEHTAMKAFNDGLINQYIRKDNLDLDAELAKSIESAQKKYFDLITRDISRLIIRENWRSSAISDEKFAEFFAKLILEYKIVEFYILETAGCYLMLDEKGQTYGLFVADDEMMENMLIEAFYHDNAESKKAMKSLKDRELMLCYNNKDSITLPHIDEWSKYLYPCQKLEGSKNYYWSMVKNGVDLFRDKIIYFDEYYKDNFENFFLD